MITVRKASYTLKELEELYTIFYGAAAQIAHNYCTNTSHCMACPVHHLCEDINSTAAHLSDTITARKSRC